MSARLLPLALVAVFLQGIACRAQSQPYTIGPRPAWVLPHDVSMGHISDTACISGGMAYLLVDRQYDLASHSMYYGQAIKLTSADGVQQGSRFSASFDPSFQQFTLNSLRIIRNGEVLERLIPAKIRSLQREEGMDAYLYDGSVTVVSDLHDVRVGDVIEYTYTIKGWDPTEDGRFHKWLSLAFSMPVGFCYTRIIVPDGRSLTIRTSGDATPESTMRTARGTEHIWESRDLHCIAVDDGAPDWYDGYPTLEVTEYKNMDDLRAWGNKLFMVNMEPGPELSARIAQFRELPDAMARLDSAVGMVQQEVRYLGFEDGIGAYRPHPPRMVYKQRFGDCKDKSLLLVCVLRACGIQAAPALVNASTGRGLNAHLPRPGLFNHCIVCVESGGSVHWIDPTLTNNGGSGKTRYTPDYGYALVLDGRSGGLERMQVNNLGIMEVKEQLTVAEVGTDAELTAEVKYSGRFADAMRNAFANSTLADLGQRYTEYYSGLYGPCEAIDPLSGTYDAQRNIFTTKEHYRIPHAWDTLSDGHTLQLSVTASGIKDYLVAPSTPVRNAPLLLGAPFQVKQRTEVLLPNKWGMSPYQHEVQGYGVSFKSSLETGDQTAVFNYAYGSDSVQVSVADFPAFYAQQQKIFNNLSYLFTWTPQTGDGTRPAKAFSWLLVVLIFGGAIVAAALLYRYDPPWAEGIHPKFSQSIGSFLILPAIGLCIAPFTRTFQMFTDHGTFFYMPAIFWKAYPDQQWAMGAYGVFSQAYNIGMLVFTVVLALLFFRRRTSVPLLFKLYYSAAAIGLMLDAYIYASLDLKELTGNPYPSKDLVQSIVGAAIWIPVFHLSSRVKNTFVVRLNTPPEAPSNEGSLVPVEPSHPSPDATLPPEVEGIPSGQQATSS